MNINHFKKHIPLKKYGQNFLIDQNIINNIIKSIDPKKKELFVEIGPGLAALTKPICKILEELIVIEIDLNLLNFLKKCSFYSKLKVFFEDALYFDYIDLFHKKKN